MTGELGGRGGRCGGGSGRRGDSRGICDGRIHRRLGEHAREDREEAEGEEQSFHWGERGKVKPSNASNQA